MTNLNNIKERKQTASPSPIKATQQLFFLLLSQLCFALLLRCVIDDEPFLTRSVDSLIINKKYDLRNKIHLTNFLF